MPQWRHCFAYFVRSDPPQYGHGVSESTFSPRGRTVTRYVERDLLPPDDMLHPHLVDDHALSYAPSFASLSSSGVHPSTMSRARRKRQDYPDDPKTPPPIEPACACHTGRSLHLDCYDSPSKLRCAGLRTTDYWSTEPW